MGMTINYTPPYIHATLKDPKAIVIGYDDPEDGFISVVLYSNGKFSFLRDHNAH